MTSLRFLPEQIEPWPLARLKPYERNPRLHSDDQVAKVAASIASYGDSTKADDAIRVMHNHRAILFASDPLYLVDYDDTNHPSKQGDPDKNKDWGNSYGITWDDSSQGPELYEGFIKAAIEHAILPNAAWYCWHASRRQAMVEGVWEKYGAFVHQQIVWAKDRGILTRSYYLWQHEPCFFGWLKGNKPPRVSDDYPSTVWNLPTVKVGEKTEHPTSKPVAVFAIPMRQHTRPGDVCYEPFSGSGSQIIAGETTGRRVFAIEIRPQYVDVAVKRWQTASSFSVFCRLPPGRRTVSPRNPEIHRREGEQQDGGQRE
jgi:DNA modification methylase